MSTIDLNSLPAINHPYADYSLVDAARLACGQRKMSLQPGPTTLEGVREVIRDMISRAPFNWITGQAALDVLDAAIDGRDLQKDCRLL